MINRNKALIIGMGIAIYLKLIIFVVEIIRLEWLNILESLCFIIMALAIMCLIKMNDTLSSANKEARDVRNE